jgi:hypothetical protein
MRNFIVHKIIEDFMEKYNIILENFDIKEQQYITEIYCKIANYVQTRDEEEFWEEIVKLYETKILKKFYSKAQNMFLLKHFTKEYLLVNHRQFYSNEEYNKLDGELQFLTKQENIAIKKHIKSFLIDKKWKLFKVDDSYIEKQNLELTGNKQTENSINKEFTTARQVLAIHYLLEYTKVKNIDKTEIARFIEFLTGKNYDNIYEKVKKPFKLNDKEMKKDLRFIKTYFENMGMKEVVKMIINEIETD